MFAKEITQTTIFRVLIAGFMLVILLLLAAGFMSVRNIRPIQVSVADLVEEGLVTIRLVDDIQREQAALSAVFNKLSRDPEYVDREKTLKELNDTDKRIAKIGDSVTDTLEEELWDELQKTTAAFSTEARRLLSVENPTTLLSRDLFRRHEESLRVVARLAAASYQNASGPARRQRVTAVPTATQPIHSHLLMLPPRRKHNSLAGLRNQTKMGAMGGQAPSSGQGSPPGYDWQGAAGWESIGRLWACPASLEAGQGRP